MAIRNKTLYDLTCEENRELRNNKQKGMEVKNMGHLSHVILNMLFEPQLFSFTLITAPQLLSTSIFSSAKWD